MPIPGKRIKKKFVKKKPTTKRKLVSEEDKAKAASKVFQDTLESGELRVSYRLPKDNLVPGIPEGGWIFGRIKKIGSKVSFEYLGDSVPLIR